jgi:Secretion system C-terminal sorting domain/FG-GAP-like repeat
MIFLGGNPMSTTPVTKIVLTDVNNVRAVSAMDINADGIKDILISYLDTNNVAKINIYYGGKNIHTTPDLVMHGPEDSYISYGAYLIPLKDFDGTGKGDLMVFDPYNRSNFPYSVGTFYIYRASTVFDTIPYATIKGDSLSNRYLSGSSVTIGDLDGDGLTDIAITGTGFNSTEPEFISFYKSNSQWNMTPYVTYYSNQHTFVTRDMKIIQDINGDKKDDILIDSYGNFYPYYYLNSILYGGFPIDTIPKIGLNTQNTAIFDVVSPGDINKDGYNDLLVGLSVGFGDEEARLWVGGNPMPTLPKRYWGGDDNGYGKLIAKVGDVNGDGIPDICVGQLQPSCTSGFVRIFKGDTLFRQPLASVKGLNNTPEKFYLDNPYPNPFNPVTVITYELSVKSHVSLKVYDILGKDVAVLVDEDEPSGKHESKFDASKYRISSGVYFIKLTSTTNEQTTTATKKIVLTK